MKRYQRHQEYQGYKTMSKNFENIDKEKVEKFNKVLKSLNFVAETAIPLKLSLSMMFMRDYKEPYFKDQISSKLLEFSMNSSDYALRYLLDQDLQAWILPQHFSKIILKYRDVPSFIEYLSGNAGQKKLAQAITNENNSKLKGELEVLRKDEKKAIAISTPKAIASSPPKAAQKAATPPPKPPAAANQNATQKTPPPLPKPTASTIPAAPGIHAVAAKKVAPPLPEPPDKQNLATKEQELKQKEIRLQQKEAELQRKEFELKQKEGALRQTEAELKIREIKLQKELDLEKERKRREREEQVQMGDRSYAISIRHEATGCEYQKEKYEFLNTKIDFVHKSTHLASIGLTTAINREVILVSEKDEKKIVEQWQKFFMKAKHEKKLTGPLNDEQVLHLLNQFTKSALIKTPPPNDTYNLEDEVTAMAKTYYDAGKTIQLPNEKFMRPVIFISDYLDKKAGVCRHHSIVNGILLKHLIKSRDLTEGEVRQMRDEVVDDTKNLTYGAHSVITYLPKSGGIWVIDSANFDKAFQIEHDTPLKDENKKLSDKFKEMVGKKFYKSFYSRLHPAEEKKKHSFK